MRGTPEQAETIAQAAVTTLMEDNADARACYSVEKTVKAQAEEKDARDFENHLEYLEEEEEEDFDDDDERF